MFAYALGCLLIVGALWLAAVATGWGLPYLLIVRGLEWLKTNPWESIFVAGFLLLLGLFLFVRPRESMERGFLTFSKGGEVRISQEALQEIITRSAMVLPGVLQVQSSLKERETGLQIIVSCQFGQDVLIPQMSEELQAKVKQDVELYTGILVTEVKVLVRSLEKTRLARVR
jgi:uncharacterized alkaline shock family protein YloU